MKKLETENHVKDIVRQWGDARHAFHFAVVQNGMGAHGIHDRIMSLPIVVTPEMVGKTVGVFCSVEAKRPGRRGGPSRGMSKHQVMFMEGVKKTGGLSVCVDGYDDLADLDAQIQRLMGDVVADLNTLQRVLEASVRRKGEVPLTNAHLLNMIRMANRAEERASLKMNAALNEVLGEDSRWGKG